MDSLSAIFLVLTSLLFLGATVYGIGYVAREPVAGQLDFEDGSLFKNEPESVFTGGILLLLATMSLAILSRHLALQWVAIEATTLASAPLIYYHQNRRSLEAAWKYLILCSVGIAVALLGIFFIRMTMQDGPHDLTLAALLDGTHCVDSSCLSQGQSVRISRSKKKRPRIGSLKTILYPRRQVCLPTKCPLLA